RGTSGAGDRSIAEAVAYRDGSIRTKRQCVDRWSRTATQRVCCIDAYLRWQPSDQDKEGRVYSARVKGTSGGWGRIALDAHAAPFTQTAAHLMIRRAASTDLNFWKPKMRCPICKKPTDPGPANRYR